MLRLFYSLLVVVVGLAGRALLDKLLALKGGAVLVAAWAQLASLSEMVSSVSLSGFGVALIARVAGCPPDQRAAWLRTALRASLALSGVVALLVVPVLAHIGRVVIPTGQEGVAMLALASGWLGLAPALAGLALVGAGRADAATLLAAAGFAPPLLLLALSPFAAPLADVLAGQILFGAACLGALLRLRPEGTLDADARRALLRFAPAGLAIGLLSPAASILGRTRIGEVLSWHDAGMVQAIWRSNEWIVALCGGLLSNYFLPQLGAARDHTAFSRILRRAAWQTLLPAGALMALLWLLLPQVVTFLYRADFIPPHTDAVPLLLGDWLRVAAWVPLVGLFAVHAPRAVASGEFLSLPLFAVLLWSLPLPLSLRDVGWAWAGAYLAYGLYNALVLRSVLAWKQ